jgi:hypothetical protein
VYATSSRVSFWGISTEIDTIEEQQTEKIETEVGDDDRIRKHTGVRNIIQGVLLGHLLHTISYTNPPLPTGPPQKKKLPDGQFCTGEPSSSFTMSVYIKSTLEFSTRVVE